MNSKIRFSSFQIRNTSKRPPQSAASKYRNASRLPFGNILKPDRIFLICALTIMGLIWIFSSGSGADSQNQSDQLIRILSLPLNPQISFWIRKSAHFLIYALLGFFWFWYWIFHTSSCFRAAGAAIVFCLGYAAADEFHQSFVPGRSAELRDVLIDGSGALLGVLIACLLIFLIRRHFQKPAFKAGRQRADQMSENE